MGEGWGVQKEEYRRERGGMVGAVAHMQTPAHTQIHMVWGRIWRWRRSAGE